MFWGAEIEIYRLASSNGPLDENQNGVQTKNGNESGRLGRYKNGNEARKNVLRSWDQDLSIGDVKRVPGDRKNIEIVSMFLDFRTGL